MQYQNLLSHLLLSLSPAAFANHFLTLLFFDFIFLALLKSSNKYRGVGGGGEKKEEEKKQAAHGRAETLAQGP